MDVKLFDSELKVMDVLWKKGDLPAKEIAKALTNELGWNVNKGLIELRFSSQLANGRTPCLVMSYSVAPEYDYF